MDHWMAVLEKATMYTGVTFALSLFYMLARMKVKKQFNIRDHVASSLSFDLDFKVLKIIRNTYAKYYGNFLPVLNLYSFIISIVGIISLSVIPVCRAFWAIK